MIEDRGLFNRLDGPRKAKLHPGLRSAIAKVAHAAVSTPVQLLKSNNVGEKHQGIGPLVLCVNVVSVAAAPATLCVWA